MPETNLKTLREVKVFISSPGDVHEERRRVEAALARLGEQAHVKPHLRLNALCWEDVPPEGGQTPQTIIDQHLGEAGAADIYICILWHRMGTPTTNANGESFHSGTESEFFSAYRSYEISRRPHLLLYHCPRPVPAEHEPEQLRLVEQFLSRFKSSPPELKGLWNHFAEADAFEDRLFADLNTLFVKYFLPAWQPHTQRHDFYQHISLPPNYVPREELLAELRAALLADNNTIALTSVKAKPTALHGMGGIGKSVMARALCEEEQVQAAFPHGILWTTLGQEPNLNEKLREWIHALGGVISENAPTLDQLKNNLNKLLDGRQCLLVVDDVWRKTHAETFRVGSACRLLLTTRDAAVAEDLGAMVQPVPLMARAEAVRLLEEWAEGNLSAVEAELKERIVERLGRLPLALRLAGAQLRAREPQAWLAAFEVHQLKAKRIEGVHDSLVATFELSLKELGGSRPLYTAMAVFKEDETILESTLQKLWSGLANFDVTETADFLEDLASRALLTIENKIMPRRASLHDLLRDLIASELHSESRHYVHICLLRAYRATCSDAGWHTAPDDGYLYDHLVYLLENTQQWDELHALFKNQNWMQVRVPQSNYDYDSYLADLMIAWQDAHKRTQAQIAAHETPTALADCLRYALIRTSVNSLAANHAPELVAHAVETGLWEPQRAMSLASKVPDPEQRAEFYVALLATKRLDYHSRVLANQKGLLAARTIVKQEVREKVLAFLSLQLVAVNLTDAISVAREIKNKWSCARALEGLAQQLTGIDREQALKAALEAAREIQIDESRAKVLIRLAHEWKGEERESILRDAAAAAKEIKYNEYRAKRLGMLAIHLKGEERKQLLQLALEAVSAIEGEDYRAETLIALAPQLTGENLEDAIKAAPHLFSSEKTRAKVLSTLTMSNEESESISSAIFSARLPIESENDNPKTELVPASQSPQRDLESAITSGAVLTASRVIDDDEIYLYTLRRMNTQILDEKVAFEITEAEIIMFRKRRAPTIQPGWFDQKIRQQEWQIILEGIRNIRDEKEHARIQAFVQVIKNQKQVSTAQKQTPTQMLLARLPIEQIQTTLLEYIYQSQNMKRSEVLQLCAYESLFAPRVLSHEILATIAQHIIEICRKWQWL